MSIYKKLDAHLQKAKEKFYVYQSPQKVNCGLALAFVDLLGLKLSKR